jgi:hypothetical protein
MSELFGKEHEEREAFLLDELRSLGIDPNRKNELNDKKELSVLVHNLKHSILQDYKLAYSEEGDRFKDEAKSTITN